MAGGFSIAVENIEKFKNFIFKRYKKKNIESSMIKSLYLDCIIAPTALNLEFYNKVNTLAPFGSGNPEPKFVLENMKSVNTQLPDKLLK